MNADLNAVNTFLQIFSDYIDSGFGVLGSDVKWLCSALIGVDLTLAGLWFAWGDGGNSITKVFVRKILHYGTFAFILNNFNNLAKIIFNSFASIGMEITQGILSAQTLLQPGALASQGFNAAQPILQYISKLSSGWVSAIQNAPLIFILLLTFLLVLVSFLIVAVQMCVTIIEFKLTSLAGFVLVPFAFWNKSSFMAEKVLGNVMSTGIKVLAIAIVVGVGSDIFSKIVMGFGTNPDSNIKECASLAIAALSFLMISLNAPGIAAALISGGPQLGAGSAIRSAVGAGVGAAAVAAGPIGAAKAVASAPAAAFNATKAAASLAGTGVGTAERVMGRVSNLAQAGNPLAAAGGAMKDAVSARVSEATSGLNRSFGVARNAASNVEVSQGGEAMPKGATDAPAWSQAVSPLRQQREGRTSRRAQVAETFSILGHLHGGGGAGGVSVPVGGQADRHGANDEAEDEQK